MRKAFLLLALVLLSSLSACTENPAEETTQDLPVDPNRFFASSLFEHERGYGGPYAGMVVYPYEVEDMSAWLEWIYEGGNTPGTEGFIDVSAQLQKDYSKFDPLLLLENDPEALAANFASYKDEELLSLDEVLHMQALRETLEAMLAQSERWEPGPESFTLRPPEGYPGWYGLPEDGESEPIQSLLYVDWKTWQTTNTNTWKSYDETWGWEREDETITFFSREETSPFAYLPNESGFFLAGTSSYSYSNMDGGGSGQHKIIYAYDTAGRLQESFMIVDGEGIMTDIRLFEFTSYVYDEKGRLSGVRSSDVVLASNQLSMPELDYEQYRYWAQAPLLP